MPAETGWKPVPLTAVRVPKRVRVLLTIPAAQRTPEQVAAVFDHWRTTVPEFSAANAQLDALWQQWPEGTTAYALVARTEERMTSVLNRGDWLKPTRGVTPGVPLPAARQLRRFPVEERGRRRTLPPRRLHLPPPLDALPVAAGLRRARRRFLLRPPPALEHAA